MTVSSIGGDDKQSIFRLSICVGGRPKMFGCLFDMMFCKEWISSRIRDGVRGPVSNQLRKKEELKY